MKKKNGNICCAICGSKKDLTREHVPPKCIFLKPRPKNMITVPTCKSCNENSMLDDEYFRIYLTAGVHPDSYLMQLWKEKVVNSTFARTPALKRQILIDSRNAIEQHRISPFMTPEGEPLSEEYVDRIRVFETDRIEKILKKIVCCLYYFHYAETMPKSQCEVIEIFDTETLISIIRNRIGHVGGEEGEFIYALDSSGEKGMEWYLLFNLQKAFLLRVKF